MLSVSKMWPVLRLFRIGQRTCKFEYMPFFMIFKFQYMIFLMISFNFFFKKYSNLEDLNAVVGRCQSTRRDCIYGLQRWLLNSLYFSRWRFLFFQFSENSIKKSKKLKILSPEVGFYESSLRDCKSCVQKRPLKCFRGVTFYFFDFFQRTYKIRYSQRLVRKPIIRVLSGVANLASKYKSSYRFSFRDMAFFNDFFKIFREV